MNLGQIDSFIDKARTPEDKVNIVYMGFTVYDQLEDDLKILASKLGTFKTGRDMHLILSAFEYRGLFCVRSPAVPENSAMVCLIDEVELRMQKENIGWQS